MTQSWAFGEAKRIAAWHPVRLVFRRDKEPVAICQVLYKSVLGWKPVARINQGPLMLDGCQGETPGVYRAVRRRWRYLICGGLLIAPALEYGEKASEILLSAGFRKRNQSRWTSTLLDLTPSETDLRKALSGNWRNHLRKAEKLGLRLSHGQGPGDLDWISQKHEENEKNKRFKGPSTKLLRALYAAAPGNFHVFRAEFEGRYVAGLVACKFGNTAHYYIGWVGDDGRRLGAGNFLLWNAACALKQLGCVKFDLGGTDTRSRFGTFKRGVNGDNYQLAGEFFCF
jgi:lipid II:glycine glycyltransferase (peptidoglycan interpeptide bridge formation enzyme)